MTRLAQDGRARVDKPDALTPDGVKMDRDVNRSEPDIIAAGKRLDRTILVVLTVAVTYFAGDKFLLSPQQEAPRAAQITAELAAAHQAGRSEALVESYGDRSIAVLAFEDLSPDKDQEYLSDGIAEELPNLLAKIPELRVTSRHSAFSYKGKDKKLTDVARELNVAHILEGSVRKSGNRVRVTAQLVDARSDTHLWSETFDRNLEDIFAIQDEIAAAVAVRLEIQLLGRAPRAPEADPQAYSLVLQAPYLSDRATAEGYEQAIALLEEALAIDPGYAAAWDHPAAIYANQAGRGLRPPDEGYALAREMAEKSLALNPEHAPAHARLGWSTSSFVTRSGPVVTTTLAITTSRTVAGTTRSSPTGPRYA